MGSASSRATRKREEGFADSGIKVGGVRFDSVRKCPSKVQGKAGCYSSSFSATGFLSSGRMESTCNPCNDSLIPSVSQMHKICEPETASYGRLGRLTIAVAITSQLLT